ncbi:hypothetical protein EV383_1943 [Pseudonocardia sediminis]|uniref:Uncharacterized protein n=1 Tax=Pseudonocardia sediminis TaxID=1397368 RepID=A0A4Q7UY48_PSEST|nr:hypothetical protein EV383_1943 [Pseudonocardia sediminis]
MALRACLVALALVLLVAALSACGNAELPAAPAVATPPPTTTTSPAPTTTAPPTTTAAPTTEPTTDSATPTTEGRAAGPRATTPAPRAGGDGGGTGNGGGTGGGGTTGGRGTPIWPATDAASARTLQKQVDGGRDPWLLDPAEVATSYSGVALKYRDPSIFTIRPGVVDVQDGATRAKATITLAQTVRQGDGGIWLVTGARRR